MGTTTSFRLVTLVLIGALLAGAPRRAVADSIDEAWTKFFQGMLAIPHSTPKWTVVREDAGAAAGETEASPEASNTGQAATFRMTNYNARTEPGEPTFGGVMKKTVWAKLKPTKTGRVVIHTFGGEYDTALAVYTGKKLKKLRKVTFNDNFPVAGLSDTASLVQFKAKKGVQYSVQIGSTTGAEGDVYANVSLFPPDGGITAHLALVDATPWQDRDYVCQAGQVGSPICGAPTFLLHNSTTKTLTVTASTDLDPAFGAPAAITLRPREAKTVAFTVSGLDTATARTVAGHFTFTARQGSKVIGKAQVRGLVVVKPAPTLPDVLVAEVTPQAKAGYINEPQAFKVKLTNTGTAAARGCHARSEYSGYVAGRTVVGWRPIKSSGKPAGAPNSPITIPAKATVWMEVSVASQQSRAGDLALEIPVVPDLEIDCNNTAPVAFDHKNRFDITARGGWLPAKVVTKALRPKGGVLEVPSNGATFRVSARNTGPTAPLIVWPKYVRPFDEYDADKQFSVRVCRTKTARSKCLAPLSSYVGFEAKKGSTSFFMVKVGRPKTDPGFDPGERRVFLIFSHRKPDGYVGTSQVTVAAQSIAPRRK